jgi:hypothetical protein
MGCRRKFPTLLKVIAAVLSALISLACIADYRRPTNIQKRLLKYKMIEFQQNSDIKHVLFFSNYWHFKYWGLSNETIDANSPEMEKCAFKNCIFTHKRNFLKQTHEYDAVLFHQSISTWYFKENLEPIKTRSPHQLYILVSQE